MTGFAVLKAFEAADENLSRTAFRTAYYNRVQPKHLPKSENAIFKKDKPRQSLKDQHLMMRIITGAMH